MVTPDQKYRAGTPFRRALIISAKIAEARMAPPHLRDALMAQVGEYVSRGKGRGNHQASDRTVAQDKRAARKARNVKRHRGFA